MFKETIIITMVLVLIVGANYFMEYYISNSSEDIIGKIESLRQKVVSMSDEDDTKEIENLADEIYSKWEEINKKWTVVVDHAELDSIHMSLLGIKASIQKNELSDTLQEIEKSKFLIGHIKEKEEFSLKNIF